MFGEQIGEDRGHVSGGFTINSGDVRRENDEGSGVYLVGWVWGTKSGVIFSRKTLEIRNIARILSTGQ